jgi:hypothetical protein
MKTIPYWLPQPAVDRDRSRRRRLGMVADERVRLLLICSFASSVQHDGVEHLVACVWLRGAGA